MSSRWKSEWKSACPIFALNRRVHFAARTFSGPPIGLLSRLWFSMWFNPSRAQTVYGNERVSYRCLIMNLYSSVSITKHNFLSINRMVVFSEFWRFFDAVQGFYINSAPESNRLFVFILLTRSNTNYSNCSTRIFLLFLLYINDIYLSSDKLNFYLFALLNRWSKSSTKNCVIYIFGLQQISWLWI